MPFIIPSKKAITAPCDKPRRQAVGGHPCLPLLWAGQFAHLGPESYRHPSGNPLQL